MIAPRKSKDIESYIRKESLLAQKALKALRALIRKTAPTAIEKIAWGMPTFYLRGNLIHFAAFKHHYSVFPGSDAVAHFSPALKRQGWIHSKGTIQIPYGQPLPVQLLTKVVQFCAQRNLSESQDKPSGTRLQRPVRPRHSMPKFVQTALLKNHLMENYRARPPYQQNDYLGWINRAAREQTKQKRLTQMLQELRRGDRYMNMKYRSKKVQARTKIKNKNT